MCIYIYMLLYTKLNCILNYFERIKWQTDGFLKKEYILYNIILLKHRLFYAAFKFTKTLIIT